MSFKILPIVLSKITTGNSFSVSVILNATSPRANLRCTEVLTIGIGDRLLYSGAECWNGRHALFEVLARITVSSYCDMSHSLYNHQHKNFQKPGFKSDTV